MYTGTLQSTPIDNEGYKQAILDFIENNQGCTKQAVVMALDKYRSRKSVFKLIRDLEDDKIVVDTKDINKPNRKGSRLVIDKNNLQFSVPKQLDDFGKAYINLLHISQKRIPEDYPIIRRSYSIKGADPSKWKPSYIKDYLSTMQDNFQDVISDVVVGRSYEDLGFNRLEKRWKLVKESQNLLKQLSDLVGDSSKLSSMSNSKFNVLASNAKNMLVQLDPRSNFSKHMTDSYRTTRFYKLQGYNHYVLLRGAFTIFHLFKDLIFWKSIIIWPRMTHDKETLSKLYSLAYSKIAELQLQLSQFISSNILFSNIDSNNLLTGYHPYLYIDENILVFYFSLGLDDYIVPVFDLLINMFVGKQSMWESVPTPFWCHFFCYYKMEHQRKQLRDTIKQLRDLYSQQLYYKNETSKSFSYLDNRLVNDSSVILDLRHR